MLTAAPSRILRDLESAMKLAREKIAHTLRAVQNRGALRPVPMEQVTLRKMARSNITVQLDAEQLQQLDELQREGARPSVRR